MNEMFHFVNIAGNILDERTERMNVQSQSLQALGLILNIVNLSGRKRTQDLSSTTSVPSKEPIELVISVISPRGGLDVLRKAKFCGNPLVFLDFVVY